MIEEKRTDSGHHSSQMIHLQWTDRLGFPITLISHYVCGYYRIAELFHEMQLKISQLYQVIKGHL